MSGTRKVHIKSYGCQMNVYDSHRMADLLAREGYSETAVAEDADLVILNTCHIREKAAEKVYSELGRLRVLKQEGLERGRPVKIAVAGCVAQAEGAEIVRRSRAVDLVIGSQNYHRLPELLAATTTGPAVDTDFPTVPRFDTLPSPTAAAIRGRGVCAFLTIQEGCDKFCTFCVVPYTRGSELSRPAHRIVEEAARLADAGVREITLIGQNVNAYHGEDEHGRELGLAGLLERLARVPGLARLRYTTSHPRDMDAGLIAAHRDLPALMPQLHLPVQSGSDRILAAMNRRHTRRDYAALVDRLRAARPDIALSSDFIVGFPGETGADFEATLSLVDEIGFSAGFFFKYSPRSGTPAAGLEGRVPEAEMSARLARLHAAIERRQAAALARTVGQTYEVLFEKAGRHPGQLMGRTPYLQAVNVVASKDLIGDICRVRIDQAGANSLFGTLAEARRATPTADAVAQH